MQRKEIHMPEKYTIPYPVKKIYSDGRSEDTDVLLARELPVKVFLDGKMFTTLFASPIELKELAVGHLITEGILSFEEIQKTEIKGNEIHILTQKGNIIDLSNHYVLSTGRQPAYMVTKAARAGIPLVVTKAMPFDSGVEAAKKANICLVGQLRKEAMLVFANEWRIKTDNEASP